MFNFFLLVLILSITSCTSAKKNREVSSETIKVKSLLIDRPEDKIGLDDWLNMVKQHNLIDYTKLKKLPLKKSDGYCQVTLGPRWGKLRDSSERNTLYISFCPSSSSDCDRIDYALPFNLRETGDLVSKDLDYNFTRHYDDVDFDHILSLTHSSSKKDKGLVYNFEEQIAFFEPTVDGNKIDPSKDYQLIKSGATVSFSKPYDLTSMKGLLLIRDFYKIDKNKKRQHTHAEYIVCGDI